MRTKFTFLFSLVIAMMLFSQITRAEVVPIEKARLVAKNFFYERVQLVREGISYKDVVIAKEDVIADNGTAAIYVFKFSNNNGSIMISAESNTYPILFYTFENNFSLNNTSPTMNYFIESYKDQIIVARRENLSSTEEINTTWSQYLDGKTTKSTTDITTVGPLTKTTWDQSCYYNTLCPTGASGFGYCNHMPTGCVATAMAQFMKYYGWPAQGVGTHTNSNNSALTANFGATSYGFASMPLTLTAENTAVATLMLHAGISVNMKYATGGSSASLSTSATSLVSYFKYSSSTIHVNRSSYTTPLWNIQLRAMLINSRPVLYGGSGSSGGHAFILDGFQYPEYYHINIGWGGTDNGYYYLSAINSSNGAFNSNQDAILNAYPSNMAASPLTVNESKLTSSLNIIPNPNKGNFSLVINNDYNGSYSIKIYDITSRLIEERIINKGNSIISENISLTNLNKGLYFISIENENLKEVKKFIVE